MHLFSLLLILYDFSFCIYLHKHLPYLLASLCKWWLSIKVSWTLDYLFMETFIFILLWLFQSSIQTLHVKRYVKPTFIKVSVHSFAKMMVNPPRATRA